MSVAIYTLGIILSLYIFYHGVYKVVTKYLHEEDSHDDPKDQSTDLEDLSEGQTANNPQEEQNVS